MVASRVVSKDHVKAKGAIVRHGEMVRCPKGRLVGFEGWEEDEEHEACGCL